MVKIGDKQEVEQLSGIRKTAVLMIMIATKRPANS